MNLIKFSPYPLFPSHLTLFLMGIGLPLAIFLLLASCVWNQGDALVWDVPLLEAIHATSQPLLDTIALTITPLGVIWGILPVLAGVGCALLYQRNWRSLVYIVITPLGSALLNRLFKLYFHRPRPQLWEVVSPTVSYAFPSGHAMSSATLVVVLSVIAWPTRWRWLTMIGGGLFMVSIGWTRLYLGKHYPSDVLAGWLLAIAWSITLMLLIRPYSIKTALISKGTVKT